MKVVAVFGGGGAKSIACVGAWKALVEAGLTPSHLVGTSMGAVIAAAFASGATYDEVVIAGRSLSQRDVARVDPLALLKGAFATHLLKPAGLRGVIERFVTATRVEQLRIPLTITATDLDSGELVLLGASGLADVPLHDALYASCALPPYFPPLALDGRRPVDGGLPGRGGRGGARRRRPGGRPPARRPVRRGPPAPLLPALGARRPAPGRRRRAGGGGARARGPDPRRSGRGDPRRPRLRRTPP